MQFREGEFVKVVANYYYFFKWLWHTVSTEPLVDNWHIKVICNELTILSRYLVNREVPPYHTLIINIPPGSTKSTLITQVYPVWLWLQDPSLKTIISTHSDRLSTKHSLNARGVIDSIEWSTIIEQYITFMFGSRFRITKDTEKDWHNSFGGMYYATSTGGSITGEHAHLQIWDDPQTPEMVVSEAKREASHRFYEKTMTTRKIDKDKTPTIIVMQRLHEDDICGRRINKQGVKHICLPAEIGDNIRPDHLRDYYEDGLLDIVRLHSGILDMQKEELGSLEYAGQYDQDPRPKQGNLVHDSWFNYCTIDEVPDLIADLWIDGAYTEQTKNDPTGLLVTKYSESQNRLYILHFHSAYMELPELLKFIPIYAEDNGLTERSKTFIEPKASGKSIKQMLKSETMMNPIEILGPIVSDGKLARLNAGSPRIESGRVWMVKGSWNDEFMYQLTTFPNAKHDEGVDLLAYAINHYFRRRMKITQHN